MASSLSLFPISLIFFFFFHLSNGAPSPIIHPIRKDPSTLQYYTSIDIGTPLVYPNVVIDLGTDLLWFNCDDGYYNSSSYTPIGCGSTKCKLAKGSGCTSCNSAPRPGCTNNTCGVTVYNAVDNLPVNSGLGQDVVAVYETDGRVYLNSVDVPQFLFSCAYSFLLGGLANGTRGIIGLGRTRNALHAQVALSRNLTHKFALCIPSTTIETDGPGDIFIGGGPYYMPPHAGDMSKSLITTPLITNPVSTAVAYSQGEASYEYFIKVKSISVDGKSVCGFNTSLLAIDKFGNGGTKFSTINPYTILQSSIYKALIKDYVKRAASWKITRVASVKPFGACFSSKTIANSSTTGPAVPSIDLALQSKSVYWRIYGANSMVKVNEEVLCLGFVDGGSEPRTSIVIGGHQLEDNLIEFDLASSKIGFSSSLLLLNTSCSQSRIF